MRTYLARIALIVVAAVLGSGVWTNAQEETRKLFESGQYQAVVEQTPNDAPPDAQYVKGLAHLKLNQTDQAKAAFRRLERAGDAWRSVGQSAVALIDGNRDAALEAAKAAVARDAGLAAAHYQLGSCSKSAAKPRGGRCLCESGGSQPPDGLRPLQRGDELLQGQTRRSNGRVLRKLPQARAECARKAGRRIDHAYLARPVGASSSSQNACPRPKCVLHFGSNGRRFVGTATSSRSRPIGVSRRIPAPAPICRFESVMSPTVG